MLRPKHLKCRTWVFVGAAILLFGGVCKPAQQQPVQLVSLNVVVEEAETGSPISQARLTLRSNRVSFTILSRTAPRQMLKGDTVSQTFQKGPLFCRSRLSIAKVLARK